MMPRARHCSPHHPINRRTDVRLMPSCLAMADLLSPAADNCWTSAPRCATLGGRPWGFPRLRAWAIPALTRSADPPAPRASAPARPDLAQQLAAFQAALPGSRGAVYLQQRGIPLALAQQYGVGYAGPVAGRMRPATGVVAAWSFPTPRQTGAS
jgi:hypothetical protein